MATCDQCGQWLGQAMTPTPGAAVPIKQPLVCTRCRLRVWRGRLELFIAIVMTIAATIVLAGISWQEWKATDPVKWLEPIPPEPPHVDPEPGDGGGGRELLPSPESNMPV